MASGEWRKERERRRGNKRRREMRDGREMGEEREGPVYSELSKKLEEVFAKSNVRTEGARRSDERGDRRPESRWTRGSSQR